MTFLDAVKACLNNFATFSGRASRSEFWYFFLCVFLLSIVASVLDSLLLSLLVTLATIVPMLAAGARRLHDTGRSGWWQLLALIPLLGGIVLLVLLAQKSDPGSNRFGAPALPGGATALAAS
jgi:uncharacterized membrane protein YhaH (DUF805 family)